MIVDALFSQNTYVASKKLLDVTALRQEAIASNLANLDTPGYKRIDVASTFQTELQQALGSQNSSRLEGLQPQLATDTTALSTGLDGNNVQLETELLNMSQNTLAHTLETQLVSAQMAKLRSAITGKSV